VRGRATVLPGKWLRCAFNSRTANSAESFASSASGAAKPHVCFDRPPRQQPRLLKHHADPCACRTRHAALIVMVETGGGFQHGALAAPGRDRRTRQPRRLRAQSPKSESTSSRSPAAFVNALRAISTSSCTGRHRDSRISNGCTRTISMASTTATKTQLNRRAKEECRIAGRRRRSRSQRR